VQQTSFNCLDNFDLKKKKTSSGPLFFVFVFVALKNLFLLLFPSWRSTKKETKEEDEKKSSGGWVAR
jgi:hypothetical protein